MKEGHEDIQSRLEGSKQGKCGNKEATTKKTNQTKNTGAECESTEADWWRFSFLP